MGKACLVNPRSWVRLLRTSYAGVGHTGLKAEESQVFKAIPDLSQLLAHLELVDPTTTGKLDHCC